MPFKEYQIWRFAYDLINAVEYLHKNNILHRDIKTLNIFLTKDYQIKVNLCIIILFFITLKISSVIQGYLKQFLHKKHYKAQGQELLYIWPLNQSSNNLMTQRFNKNGYFIVLKKQYLNRWIFGQLELFCIIFRCSKHRFQEII